MNKKMKVVVGLILLSGFLISILVFLPYLANHLGFALPIDFGLPYQVIYKNRSYSSNDNMCAGGGWCQPQLACSSITELDKKYNGPLSQIGNVYTLFGPVHPIMSGPMIHGSPPTIIWVSYSKNCFLTYVLMGGP